MVGTPPTLSAPNRDRPSFLGSFLASGMAVVWAIALAKFVFHIYFNNRYGYFRDEFDYMSCGDHLQWGYVDQPPLIPFLDPPLPRGTRRFVTQHSLHPGTGIRLLVIQAAVLARELGGRGYAVCSAPSRRNRAAVSLQRQPARHQLS